MHRPFTSRGYDALLIDYRGYGKSTGTPSEAGLCEDAQATLEWLLRHHRIEEVIFYGRSLGSGVAAYLASRHTPKSLILETPYDVLPNVIQHQVMLPLPRGIFRHHFPNDHYLSKVSCPTYILAGNRDRLIPIYLAKRLKPLLSAPSHFFVVQGAGHHNLAEFQAYHFELDRLLLP
jgi:pimeloyl-ACP methyl ester carboxylesterase